MFWPAHGAFSNRAAHAPAAGGPVLYDGVAATRGGLPSGVGAGGTTNSRSGHWARSDITAIKVFFPNWHGLTEASPGATTSIKASVEFPPGVLNQLLFSSSATGTIPDGGFLVSDLKTLSIPNGERFWIRTFRNNAVATPMSQAALTGTVSEADMGDRLDFSASDLTMTGEVPDSQTGLCYFPIPIAQISAPTVFILGDSIATGVGDANDPTGDTGAFKRTIGPLFGYINAAVGSDAASAFNNNHSKRVALMAYCSTVICNYGTNDFATSATAASLEASLTTVYATIGSKPTFQATIVPRTTDPSNTWSNTTGQTVLSSEPNRTTFNGHLRGGTFGPNNGIFDIVTTVLENPPANSGKWVPLKTDDGIHPNNAGYMLIKSNNLIDTTRIGTPAAPASEPGSGWGATGSHNTISSFRRTNDTAQGDATNSMATVRTAIGNNSGLRYIEMAALSEVLGVRRAGSIIVGLCTADTAAAGMNDYVGDTGFLFSCGHSNDGTGYNFNSGTIFAKNDLGTSFTAKAGDVLQYCVDFTNKFAYLGRNGIWFRGGVPTSGALGTGNVLSWTGTPTLYFAVSINKSETAWRLRTASFLYTPPAGAVPWGGVDTTAPILTLPTGAQTGATTATLGVTTDEGNGKLYWVVDTGATPTAAQVKLGQTSTGVAAPSSGNQTITTAGAKTASATGLTALTAYKAFFMQEDAIGNQSTVAASGTFTTVVADTTAPTLSAPTGAQTGATTATVGVTTNEANGTLYWVVATGATPTAAQVKLGESSTGAPAPSSGNQVITTTGAKTANATGLTGSTAYKAFFMHEDASTNQSTVAASATFTTAAPPLFSPADLAGLIGWWDAATGVTASGGNVTLVQDQSIGNHDLVNSGTVPLNATGFNGHPAFDFVTGNNAGLKVTPFPMTPVSVAQPKGSVFVIGQMRSATPDSAGLVVYSGNNGVQDYAFTGSAVWLFRQGTSNGIETYRNATDPNGADMSTPISPAPAYFVIACIFDGTNAKHYVNGVLGSQDACNLNWGDAVGTNGNGCFGIGNRMGAAFAMTGGAWDGPVAEVIVTTADNTADVAAVYAYAQTKYGI